MLLIGRKIHDWELVGIGQMFVSIVVGTMVWIEMYKLIPDRIVVVFGFAATVFLISGCLSRLTGVLGLPGGGGTGFIGRPYIKRLTSPVKLLQVAVIVLTVSLALYVLFRYSLGVR